MVAARVQILFHGPAGSRPPFNKSDVNIGAPPDGVDETRRVLYILYVKIIGRHEIDKHVAPCVVSGQAPKS